MGCTTPRATTTTGTDPDPRWTHIDSLSDIGQFATALAHTDTLLFDAQVTDDWRTEFRAWMYRGRFQRMTGVEQKEILAAIEERVRQLPTDGRQPLPQLLHSVLAESWWNHYQQDRWRILQRTNTAADLADPETWTQRQFMEKVIAEYRASLEPADTLKHIPVGELDALLLGDERTRTLRPTLFDLLAHRAIEVFTNSETRLAEPSWRFKLDKPGDFALFEDFAHRRLHHRDSTAWEFQALRLYQDLEKLHLNDNRPDALVDVTLARLAYVRERSTHQSKDSLYLNALETLRTRLPNDSCWSEVTLAIARWHEEMGARYNRLGGDAWKWERKTASDLCDPAIARFPGSFGAINAATLRARLEEPMLDVQCEEAVMPDRSFKIALTYQNAMKVWLRVVSDPPGRAEAMDPSGERGERLCRQGPVKEWTVDLPDDGDLNAHLIELPVDGLPLGRYAVMACDRPTFSAKNDPIVFAYVQVTRLAMTERHDRSSFDLLVLDRWTGQPRPGVKAILQGDRMHDGRWARIGEAVTDQVGRANIMVKGAQGRYSWQLEHGDDKFTTPVNYAWWGDGQGTPDTLRTFLFTDRAIYRPGQEVMFKGIVTVKRGKTIETRAGHQTTVRLFDVNGERVDSTVVSTDAFGSFNGVFKAPTGSLTGQMRIEEAHGSQWIRVEEYKRPTFEVVFDPVAGQPKLEQNVTVTGVARSYAGVPLDGAEVKWTVKRGARMPWWCGWGWRGLPWGRETEIASGTSACDAEGKFTATFLAQADRAFPRDSDPTFFFTIEADATDITGEAQSGTTSLSLGYRSIDIELDLGEAIDRNATDSLGVRVKNLNGEEVDVPMDMRITRLQAPAAVPRERLWERPDRFVLTREEHAALFPHDLYDDENDPLTWPRESMVFERLGHRSGGSAIALSGVGRWEVGSYLVEIDARDESGRPVSVKKHVAVYDPAIQNSGFVSEAYHAEPVKVTAAPGEKAEILLSSALPEARVLMEVEREGAIAVSRWFTLNGRQQLVELPVIEDDRGSFFAHLLCVERGRAHRETITINVPWSNKELKVEWMSFRDKLQPGDEEEWRLKISGPKGEKVAAQLLTTMYDASLDQFVPHGWDMSVWPTDHASFGWSRAEPFGANGGQRVWWGRDWPGDTVRSPVRLNTFGFGITDLYNTFMFADGAIRGARTLEEVEVTEGEPLVDMDMSKQAAEKAAEPPADDRGPTTDDQPIPLRSDLRESAFFLPDLLTDRDGGIVLRFKTPDALTRWKVLGLAHTKDLKLARFTRETITQKPLMVVPNLPRFLRAGDGITLTAKINVVEEGRAEGLASLSLFDPFTNSPLDGSFGLQVKDQVFIASKGESAMVSWTIAVPEGVDACGLRITAASKAGPQSTIVAADGEEHVLPVLTDKLLVTESLPLWTSKAGTKTFTLEKLKNNTSTTLRHQSLKLEYTPNPAWYAVQALPYLMEFPHECAEQVFSRYYANRLAAHIVEERPAIRQVFAQWKAAGPDAFASTLEKNAELKNILLAETPWVVNARDDRERKERIALLFDLERMGGEEAVALKKLRDMQLPNGAWPWWSGMGESRWITQHIMAGLGHLEHLKAADLRAVGEAQHMLRRAVQWLDGEVDREFKRMQRDMKKEDLEKWRPGYTEVHYLYARSFFRRWPIDGATHAATQFYLDRLAKEWLAYGLQEQAMIAMIQYRMGDHEVAALIMGSLEQRATRSDELGMYWKDFQAGMDRWSFPTETHALMIEAFHEVTKDMASVNALRTHLLKLKQTTDWKTTKATADACFALLLTGEDWLENGPMPVVKVGGVEVAGARSDSKEPAGTGYFEKTWSAAEIGPRMAEVSVTSSDDRPGWGALHWQYFEKMDKITPHESPFSIKKQVMLTEQTDQGPQLVALDKARKLKPGDKLTIRIELRTDRPVDYVHLKDLRASGLEPAEALSGYRYEGGLGSYLAIRDASMNYFFDRVPTGTHVLEYELRVTHAGDFSNGITSAMCMYAPEFSSHGEGMRVNVVE